VTRFRSVSELVAAVGSHDGIEVETAESVTRAVLEILKRLVPDEADDVAAVLPEELRDLWVATVLPD
jgi:uncharacterized protein (DUF2267 family)